VLTVPLLLPYALVQEQLQIARSRGELSMYAADVYSYATAVSEQILWGSIARVFPKAEGDLFPGLVAVFLALIGVATWRRDADSSAAPVTRLAWIVLAVSAIHLFIAGADTAVSPLRARPRALHDARHERRSAPAESARARGARRRLSRRVAAAASRRSFEREAFYLLALTGRDVALAGPHTSDTRTTVESDGLYQLLYQYVPGFDGLRVPARFNMIAVLMLASTRRIRCCRVVAMAMGNTGVVILTTALFAESLVRPFPINGMGTLRDYATPEARVYRPARAPRCIAVSHKSRVCARRITARPAGLRHPRDVLLRRSPRAAAQWLQRFLSAALWTAHAVAVGCARLTR
jgi:hypothetical protein